LLGYRDTRSSLASACRQPSFLYLNLVKIIYHQCKKNDIVIAFFFVIILIRGKSILVKLDIMGGLKWVESDELGLREDYLKGS